MDPEPPLVLEADLDRIREFLEYYMGLWRPETCRNGYFSAYRLQRETGIHRGVWVRLANPAAAHAVKAGDRVSPRILLHLARVLKVQVRWLSTSPPDEWESCSVLDSPKEVDVMRDLAMARSLVSLGPCMSTYLLPDELVLANQERMFRTIPGMTEQLLTEWQTTLPKNCRMRMEARQRQDYRLKIIAPLTALDPLYFSPDGPVWADEIKRRMAADYTLGKTCAAMIEDDDWRAVESLVRQLCKVTHWHSLNIGDRLVAVVWHREQMSWTYHKPTVDALRDGVQKLLRERWYGPLFPEDDRERRAGVMKAAINDSRREFERRFITGFEKHKHAREAARGARR